VVDRDSSAYLSEKAAGKLVVFRHHLSGAKYRLGESKSSWSPRVAIVEYKLKHEGG
jgi:hypothetical protein